MARDTAKFLRLMNEANARIAERQAEEAAQTEIEPDAFRLQRDAERRERSEDGTLRAREHPSKRPRQVVNVFGYVDLSEE